MTQEAAVAAIGRRTAVVSPIGRDIPVRNTFIHFDDDVDDDEDALPVFTRRTRSGPADFRSGPRDSLGLLSTGEEDDGAGRRRRGGAAPREAVAGGDEVRVAQDSELRESSWARHRNGTCVPCAYFILKPSGCRKGGRCDRCHLCTDAELRQWKKASRKAKVESQRLARQAQEATAAAVSPEAPVLAPGKAAGLPPLARSLETGLEPFEVKNTFIHFSDSEDESLPPMRMCKSDVCGRASKLEALRAGLSDLLLESAGFDGKKRGASSFHSSCSTSPSPSSVRRTWSRGTAASSSDSTDVGEALDEADASSEGAFSPKSHVEVGSLETQGASFETHLSGRCQPCFYFHSKADGCRRGADCIYCHFCSTEDFRQRKRTAKTLSRQLKKAAGCC